MNYVGTLKTVAKEFATVTTVVFAVASANNTAAKVTDLAASLLNKVSELTKLNAGIELVKSCFSSENRSTVGGYYKSLNESAIVRGVVTAALFLVAYKLARGSEVAGFIGRHISPVTAFVTSKI